jgi:16S rRNA (cytidine1402-2'-O)-methyltransferase
MDSISKPGLYIIATPIGNLKDITLRALEILAKSDIILCEDTRVTSKLLTAYNIQVQLKIYNDQSTEKDRNYIKDLLSQNKIISLVSDAGTPLISDPGYKLIEDLKKHDFYITSLPGASSVLIALTLSGLPSDKFSFYGFLPSKQEARRKFLEDKKSVSHTMIFFETATRLLDTLTTIAEIYHNRKIVIARELTKKFEEVKTGTALELVNYYNNHTLKGEIVLLIDGSEDLPEDLASEIQVLLRHTTAKTASLILSELKGINKNAVYKQILKLSNTNE